MFDCIEFQINCNYELTHHFSVFAVADITKLLFSNCVYRNSLNNCKYWPWLIMLSYCLTIYSLGNPYPNIVIWAILIILIFLNDYYMKMKNNGNL